MICMDRVGRMTAAECASWPVSELSALRVAVAAPACAHDSSTHCALTYSFLLSCLCCYTSAVSQWDVGESSSSSPEQTVVCRGCFIVAFAMWWQQQGQPSDMRQQLTEKRRLQYDSWCRAAEALHSQRAAVGAPLLPLSRVQEQLFAGRQLLMGQQHWPVERCSCEPDVPGRLRAVVKRLVVRFGGEESWCTLPPLNELVRVSGFISVSFVCGGVWVGG